jgi:NADH-quinone oxidoreductase subunit L
VVSGAVALAGIGLAWLRYGTAPQADPDARTLGPLFRLCNAKYYFDELYDRVFVRPLRGLAHACSNADRFGIDGLVWFISAVPRGVGAMLRMAQSGAVQGYALGMLIGVVLLLLLWRWAEPAMAG